MSKTKDQIDSDEFVKSSDTIEQIIEFLRFMKKEYPQAIKHFKEELDE